LSARGRVDASKIGHYLHKHWCAVLGLNQSPRSAVLQLLPYLRIDTIMDNRCYPSAMCLYLAPGDVAGNAATRWRISWITTDIHRVRHAGVASERRCKSTTRFVALAVGSDPATLS
jgi:hypothetical protein